MFLRYISFLKATLTVLAITATSSAQAGPKHQRTVQTASSKKTVAPPSAAPPCTDKRPWYCGVSAEDRTQALELYTQANQLFDDALFTEAEAKYRAALVHWKHPGIHYNRMLTLVALQQPIEAYQSSIEALRYGVKALKQDEYQRAIDYQKMLYERLTSLTVACEEPGAVVSLNGKEILHGPNTVQLLVLPGKHELVARKEGYLTTHHPLEAVAQQPVKVQMRLLPQVMAMLPVRRWPAWKPWALVGAGVGVGLAGGLLEWRADINNRLLHKLAAQECGTDPDGPDAPDSPGCLSDHNAVSRIHARQLRYTRYRWLGHGASLTGGIGVISGLVLAYLNREQQIVNPARKSLIRISASPYITTDTQGLVLNLSF